MSGQAIINGTAANPVFRAQIENLYVEAMVLADEAYGCFSTGRDLGTTLADAPARVALACESLKTTTRLMHVIAWLLHQRAMLTGEPGATRKDSAGQLGEALPADRALFDAFSPAVRRVVDESERLFDRAKRLSDQWGSSPKSAPVQAMMSELQARL